MYVLSGQSKKKKLIKIILQISRWFQNPPSNFRVLSLKLADSMLNQTVFTTSLGKHFENEAEMIIVGWPGLTFNTRLPFMWNRILLSLGYRWWRGPPGSWNAPSQGEGGWILPCLLHWEQVQLSEEDWRPGQQVRFQFGQDGALEKTQRKDTLLQRQQELIKMPAPRQSALKMLVKEAHRQSPNCVPYFFKPAISSWLQHPSFYILRGIKE